MNTYYGDYELDATVRMVWGSYDGGTGASITATAYVIGDVKIYKNGSLVEKTTTNGITVDTDWDARVGLHQLAIDTSNDTGDAGWWVTGADYDVLIDAVTIDAQTVRFWVGSFSTENRSALRPTVIGRTLDIAATGEVALDFGSTIGTLDAAQFGADFLTAAKIADNAFVALNFAAGSLNGKGDWNIGKTGYSVSTLAANTITAASINAAAFTAAKFGTNYIVAGSIAAAAFNGKGDWNIGKTGYSLTQAFPTNFANLSITVTTGLVTLAAVTHTGAVIPTVTAVTNAVTVGTINANVITAASINAAALTAAKFGTNYIVAGSIAAAALNGKGDWNIGKTGYTLTQTFPTNFADLAITVTTGRIDLGEWLGVAPNALLTGRVSSDVAGINNSTTAAVQLALGANEIVSGAAEATPSTTVIQTDLAETQDDIYKRIRNDK